MMWRGLGFALALLWACCAQAQVVGFTSVAGQTGNSTNNIAVVNYSQNTGGSSSLTASTTISATTGNDLVVACTNLGLANDTPTVSDGTNTYTPVPNTTSSSYTVGMYLAKNITGGSLTVTCTWAATSYYNEINVVQLSGINSTTPTDQGAIVSTGGGTTLSASITTTHAYEIVISFIYITGGAQGTVTPNSGYTLLTANTDGQTIAYELFNATTTTSAGVTWQNSTGAQGVIASLVSQ